MMAALLLTTGDEEREENSAVVAAAILGTFVVGWFRDQWDQGEVVGLENLQPTTEVHWTSE